MLAAVFAMGVHSTFFGPIKYAILPQHLEPDEVLGGTGLVEAGTYIAILAGTIVGGLHRPPQATAMIVLGVAVLGWLAGRQVPAAPPIGHELPTIDFHIVRSSIALVSATMHIPRLFLAICSISFFWTIGAVLIIEFPPLVKNVLHRRRAVASLFLAIFSVGVAIGSVVDQPAARRQGLGQVRAGLGDRDGRLRAAHVFRRQRAGRACPTGGSTGSPNSSHHPGAIAMVSIALLGVAITGGMFVVPLYAFLTTTVPKDQTARTVAANNIVNSGAMVIGAARGDGADRARRDRARRSC